MPEGAFSGQIRAGGYTFWMRLQPLSHRQNRRQNRRQKGLRSLLLACVLGLTPVAGTPALAAAIEGVDFPDSVEVGGRTLALQGLGLLRYRWVFKAYVAGLYLEPGEPASRALEDVPKRLEILYFWGIDGRDFGPAADTILERNFDAATLDPLRGRIETLHRAYRDVQPGDRYALTYVPGLGTELSLNDRPLATIPGADFARAYFSIWLGNEPLDVSLRDQLVEER